MIETAYRRIVTPIPAPASRPILERMARVEPRWVCGQAPVLWDRAEGFQVFDPYGNCWIDFSSGVLVANTGHAPQAVRDAIVRTVEQRLLHHFAFPALPRLELAEAIAALLPPPLEKVYLLTTGSEAVECAIKLARTYGVRRRGPDKAVLVSFHNAFHGRTLGALMAGGIPAAKTWIVHHDPAMVQIPFPDEATAPDLPFSTFEGQLAEAGVRPEQVAGVLLESYQGGLAAFAPAAYMQSLRRWCDEHDAVLILDEVQACCGRTGKLFAFEHYGVVPDLATLGKGISGGLPLSAVVGRADLMDLYSPAEMTNTHAGNPVSCRAAKANLDLLLEGRLCERAAELGVVLHERLNALRAALPDRIGPVRGKGLVAGFPLARPADGAPDAEKAAAVVRTCAEEGVLLFAPVGPGGGTIKINPPLVIPEKALVEGLDVFAGAVRRHCV